MCQTVRTACIIHALVPRVSQDQLDARRQEILAGARTCFARHGYEGATVRRLEEEIGLSRGAIFHHFRDKDSLFLAVAEDDAAAMVATVAQHGLVQVMRDLLTAPPPQRRRHRHRAAPSTRPTSPGGSAASWRCPGGCAPTPSSPSAGRPAPRRSPRRPASGCSASARPACCAPTCRSGVLAQFLELAYDGLVLHLATGRPAQRPRGRPRPGRGRRPKVVDDVGHKVSSSVLPVTGVARHPDPH